jgi:hypothetical protein
MIVPSIARWQVANQRYLYAALSGIQAALQQQVDSASDKSPAANPTPDQVAAELSAIAATMSAPPALETLCACFNLTSFERHLLLLCAGVEMSSAIAQLCATAQGNPQLSYATFSLGLAVLPDAHWSALAPVSSLRYWRLLDLEAGISLTQSRLRIDERVLHYLHGMDYLDDRLRGLITPCPAATELAPSHQLLANRIMALWLQPLEVLPIVQLCGDEVASKLAIAAVACAGLGLQLHRLRAIDLPVESRDRAELMRLWEREARLSRSALLVDCEGLESRSVSQLVPLLEALHGLVMVSHREPLPCAQPSSVRLDVDKLSAAEQRYLWQAGLGDVAITLNGQVDVLVSHFNLSPIAIQTVCTEFHQQFSTPPAHPTPVLWETCRSQARTRLDDLAQRIPAIATWNDLVLPPDHQQTLREIAAQVRQRSTVYEHWEFATRGANGLGISALFAGVSGTGKTMAAEILAHELQLDLYRIDLSQIVSKYIGETEKNLRRVFAAAETGGAILLFDEADALFGKRSDVKDSHDRYANIEVSYLLQRMETYRGLAILTTNLRSAIDPAFLRRLRFIVQFPFPDVAQRLEIWQRMFPPKLPTKNLNFKKLAQLNIAGGNIRNIALNAAFLAADAGEPVQMKHLLRAAQTEYMKLEKTLTDAEIGSWV